jgi:hypothetical protein
MVRFFRQRRDGNKPVTFRKTTKAVFNKAAGGGHISPGTRKHPGEKDAAAVWNQAGRRPKAMHLRLAKFVTCL